MTGKKTLGSAATGRKINARIPDSSKAAASSDVPIGRRIKGVEILIANPRPLLREPLHAEFRCRCGISRSGVPDDQTTSRQRVSYRALTTGSEANRRQS